MRMSSVEESQHMSNIIVANCIRVSSGNSCVFVQEKDG